MNHPIRSLLDLQDRLSKWEWDRVRMLQNWIVNHRHVVAVFLHLSHSPHYPACETAGLFDNPARGRDHQTSRGGSP